MNYFLIEPLSQEDRNELLTLVTEDQKEFLLNIVKRGRRTIFGNIMVEEKVQAIKSIDIELLNDERNVLDWDIIDYVDFGEGNRLGKCACGISLRYMFTVQHKITNKTITYGKDHLSAFLNLPIKDINAVMMGLKTIDYELDELLLKIKNNDYRYEILEELAGEIELPKNVKEHVEYHIPLLDRQIKIIEREINKFHAEDEGNLRKEQLEAERKARTARLKSYLKAKELIRERYELEQKERNTRVQKILEGAKIHLPISPTLAEIAYSLVISGVSSATEISHITRENFNVDKRISIGTLQRPYIYMDIVLALKSEAEKGKVYFDKESSGIEDCYFYPNSDYWPAEGIDNKLQTSLF